MSESPEEVRSLARGLEILKELNRAGSARPGAVARQVNLARSTVYRLLETLEECGFVAKSASDERYRITERTARLFARHDILEDIGKAAQAAFHEAGRRSPWLLHFSTFGHGAMIIRLASRSVIPLVPSRGYIGRALPLLHSPAGKVFLAACSKEQRQEVLRRRQIGSHPPGAEIDEIIADVSSRDYAACDDDAVDPSAASISTALMRDGSAVGSLTAVYIRSALADEAERTGLLEFLRGEARSISRQL